MRRDMNEYQNMDVLPMATAQKVKTMIIQREMKPGDRLPTEKELADLFGVSHEVPESGECGCNPAGERNLCERGNGHWGRPPGTAFHQSGEADPESV